VIPTQVPLAFVNPREDEIRTRGGLFSACRTWRYRLWRVWGSAELEHHVAFVGLNPSTADENVDDPTMRRCIGFARAWGFEGLQMLNLFATRTPYPGVMAERFRAGENVVGPENDTHILETASRCAMVVTAWGASSFPFVPGRSHAVRELLSGAEIPVHRLGVNKNGTPVHSLYIPADRKPVRW